MDKKATADKTRSTKTDDFKVVVLGSAGVGKSAVTQNFIKNTFSQAYDPTVEDFYRKEVQIEGKPYVVEILDTAGCEGYSSLLDLYIKNGEGFLLVYSIINQQSFEELSLFLDKIRGMRGASSVATVVVGNKCDMVDERRVSREEGTAFAQQYDCVFLETSAKTAENIKIAFEELIKCMAHKRIYRSNKNRCRLL